LAAEAKRMRDRIADLEEEIRPWVEKKLAAMESLDSQANRDQEELNAMYYQRAEEYENLRSGSSALLSEERSHLTEAVKDVEVLGQKLEYELSTLLSKVVDVEDGVANIERQVQEVEARAQELEDEEKGKEAWSHWVLRKFAGIDRGPIHAEQ